MKKIFLVIIFLLSHNIFAEGVSFEIKGKVFDSENSPLNHVKISIEEIGIYTTTDSSGEYKFINISNGNYHVTFSKTGYINKTLTVKLINKDVILNSTLEKSLIETATIEVTSSFEAQDISNSTYSISTVSERNLNKSKDQILGSTIANLPGVNLITTGIGLGKPVIRGLSSLSVLIVHDGVKHESQQWGDEHSPEISLYDLDRIEILRGPASLIYGAEGIGGVVNIVSKPLIFSSNNKPKYYGEVDLGGFSVNNQTTGNLMLGMGLKNLGFKGHFGYRNSANVKTPDGYMLVNTLAPTVKDTIFGGKLSNSANKEYEGGLSFGYSGNFGHINAGYETFNREIQMHDPEPDATGNQKLNTNQFEISGDFNLNKKMIFESIISYQDHSRKEFESNEDKENDIAFLNWQLKTFQSDFRLHHEFLKNINGTIGFSITKGKNESLGINKLIPNFNSTSTGIYLLEKFNSKMWSISAGGRFDTKNLDIEQTYFDSTKTISPQSLNFNAFTGSLGFVFRPNDNFDLFTNLGRGWRAPSEFELYVDGEHEGTGRIEKGILTLNPNAEPNSEASLNLDLGIRVRCKNFNAEITFFRNVVNNFIYPAPTNTIDSTNMLPIYEIKQDKGTFKGIEYNLQFEPFNFILLTWSGDYIKTENNATGTALPLTPPAKNIIELKLQKESIWKLYNPYFSFKTKIVSPQNDVDLLETKTDGYTLFYLGIGFDFIIAKTVTSLDFSIDNLFDTKYVDHLSRYKSYAMNPGRSINLKVSVPFEL
jgi:iron complex outermembrane recepter protein